FIVPSQADACEDYAAEWSGRLCHMLTAPVPSPHSRSSDILPLTCVIARSRRSSAMNCSAIAGNGRAMQDIQTHLVRLRTDAAECRLIRDQATDQAKRELFARLAEHLETLAIEVERVIAATRYRQ